MSLEDMLASLEAENQKEIDQVLANARAEADKSFEQAKREGEALAMDEERKGRDNIRQEVRTIASRAIAQARRNKAQAKADVYNKAIQTILSAAEDFRNHNDHTAFLEECLRAALARVPAEKAAVVVCDPRDLSTVDRIIGFLGRSIAVRSKELKYGGIMIELDEGRVVIDNTLDTRIKSVIEEQKPVIGKILFGDISQRNAGTDTSTIGE